MSRTLARVTVVVLSGMAMLARQSVPNVDTVTVSAPPSAASSVAPRAVATLSPAELRVMDGLGVEVRGSHSPNESVNLNSLRSASERAAVLMHRLVTRAR